MKPWRVLAGTVALIASVIGIVGFLTGKFSVSDIMGKPGVVEFRLDPATVFPGEGAMLHWYVSNADNVTIEPGIGSVSPSGTYPLPAKIDETLRPAEISVEGGEVSGR